MKHKTIELTPTLSTKVIVDKEEGRYLGHVSTALLSDKSTIFAAYILGHGRGQGVLKKSTDGGQTWSERLPVPETWSTLLQVPVIYRVFTPIGNFGGNVAFSSTNQHVKMTIKSQKSSSSNRQRPTTAPGVNQNWMNEPPTSNP